MSLMTQDDVDFGLGAAMREARAERALVEAKQKLAQEAQARLAVAISKAYQAELAARPPAPAGLYEKIRREAAARGQVKGPSLEERLASTSW